MNDRYNDMVKAPEQPAAKLLSNANVMLQTNVDAPASAPIQAVLSELDKKGEWIDILKLLAVVLPPRERVWWACLAARDYLGPKSPADPLPLATSEAWVFEPNEENCEAARRSMDNAHFDDDTVHCATAVLYADGTLGPGDLAQYPAPAGGAELSAFAMNVVALKNLSDKFDTHIQLLIDRAVDIARGGNGQAALARAEKEKDQ